MSEVDRDVLDSVLLEVDELINNLILWKDSGDFKMIIQLCEAIIYTIEGAELDGT